MIPVIYEDNHLLVVEKPVNIPVQEDSSRDPDLLSILKEDIKTRYNKPSNVYLGLVHRLDRPVGGVMVFAKTSKAASRLSDQIRANMLKRTYLAIIHGVPQPEKGRLEHYLLKDRSTNTAQVVSAKNKEGKRAVLEYKLLEGSRSALSMVSVQLLTGRSHQIRVQFSAIGHPLYGDQKYGASLNQPGQQIALWSYELRLNHPTKKEEMVFHSHPPTEYPWNFFHQACSL